MSDKDLVFLYVEDDPNSRDVFHMLMALALGYRNLTIFEDSQNFIPRLEALPRKPDVFFLDIHMRPHTGFEMLAMLRAHPDYAHCTVIALTASVMNEEVQTLRSAGFNAMISKPINPASFPELLAKILRGESVWHVTT